MGMPGIVIQIGADTKEAIDGINRVNGALGDNLTGPEKFKGAVDKAFVPAIAVLGAMTAAAIEFGKAAAEDQAAADQLALALKNNAGASKESIAATEDWITAQGKALGVSDDQLRPSLAILARATGDVAQAQSLASTAMDISAATGADLSSVSAALAKATAGSTTALGKLLPGLDKATLASGDMAAIQAELAKQVGGAAATAADSASGKMKRFALAIDETKEGIGAALLPVLEKVLPYLQQFGAWAQDNTPLLVTIGAVIAGVAASIVILKIAMEAWTVVQWLLNSALLANPITWVVVGIIALVAAVILAYKNFEGFRNVVDAVWEGIKTATGAVVGWFQTYVMPAIGVVIEAVKAYFTAYLAVVQVVWEAVKTAVLAVVAWFQEYMMPAIGLVISLIKGYFTAYLLVVQTVWTAVKTAVLAVITWFQETLLPAFQTALATLQTSFDTALSFIRGLWDGLFAFFEGLGAKFIAVGNAIVDGLRAGVLAKWDAFTGWMKGLAGNLISGVKGVFGISSPSRVFKTIGEQIVAGYEDGLAGMAAVNASVVNGTAGMVGTIAKLDPTVGYVTTAGTTAGTTGTRVGNVIVTEEQIARAITSILFRSDARNGRAWAIA
jgi:phage-related protein